MITLLYFHTGIRRHNAIEITHTVEGKPYHFYSSWGGEFRQYTVDTENDPDTAEHARNNFIIYTLNIPQSNETTHGIYYNKKSLSINTEELQKSFNESLSENASFRQQTFGLFPFDQEEDKKKYGTPEQVRLPTTNDGFKHGLSEPEAIKAMYPALTIKKKFNLLWNNCAKSAAYILKKAGCGKFDTKFLLGINNPGVKTPIGSSVLQYARHARQDILLKTINDKQLEPKKKITQVLDIEIMRLEDGIRNLDHNFLRQHEVKNKLAKLQALRNIKTAINDFSKTPKDGVTLAELFTEQFNTHAAVLGKGVFRAKTFDNLQKLAENLLPATTSTREARTVTRWSGLR